MPKENVLAKNWIEEKAVEPKDSTPQQGILPKGIKNRHINGVIIETGLAADRPDGSTNTKAFFETDTGVLAIWTGTAWLTTTLS